MNYIIFKPSGRLGNAIFRYFACILIYSLTGYTYTTLSRDQYYILDDEKFIKVINKELTIEPGKNILMDGYYQQDKIYSANKKIILDYINKHKLVHDITEDTKRVFKVVDIIDTPTKFDKFYDVVIHIRLEDFLINNDYIRVEKIVDLLNKIDFKKYTSISLVVNKIKLLVEQNYIKKLLKWFSDNNLPVKLESNDVITDFHIMKNCRILVCSNSTLSWCAAFLSEKIEVCYMPDYPIKSDRIHQTMKYPIDNTILYEI